MTARPPGPGLPRVKEGVDVLVCVCFNGPGGGSEMLTMVRCYPVAPQVDDFIELLPEIKTATRHTSEWHERVARRYLYTSLNRIEVHVELPRRELSADGEEDLRAEGYS